MKSLQSKTYSSVISPNVQRALLAVELTILVVSACVNLNSLEFQTSPLTIWKLALFGIAILPFSLILPVNRPLWQRRLYIFLGMAIIIVAAYYKITFDSLILLFLLKGCFLLPQKEAILGAIASGIILILSLALRLPVEFALIRSRGIEPYLDPIRILSNLAITYAGSCTFVILLGRVWAEEQKSKRKAEVLSEQVETLVADLERNRIARDIHDSLGHSLTTLDVQIELAQRLQATEPQRAMKSLNIAKQLTSQCLDDVRRALRTMQRSHFDLQEAIIALSEQVTQNQTFQVDVDIQFPELPLQTRYQLYCAIQECLTNIQKHAHASQVILKGSPISNGISLNINDNGKGFDNTLIHSGFGLRSMKERVQGLGGQFHLQSQPNQGTQIEIFVPV